MGAFARAAALRRSGRFAENVAMSSPSRFTASGGPRRSSRLASCAVPVP
jgi:hypothetical protein